MFGAAKTGAVAMFLCGTAFMAYGVKWIIDQGRPYTLAHVDEYQKTESKDKFGAKFAGYLISNDEKHLKHNKPHWEYKVKQLAEEEKVETGSFLKEAHSKAKNWKSDSDEQKNKLEEAVIELMKNCEEKYNEIVPIESNKPKWKEVWKYCSVDGKEHWQKETKEKN